jgi:hypothetical protein
MARYHSRLVWLALHCIVVGSATSTLESLITMSQMFQQFRAQP